eukprot:CAMPEP_0197906938 /NCGR_PEP_ID=MMETSP1439-20131203/63700_1 /TAXON_ID=66791 /ORGANISM="Gonyaulax spinifera, Strain CCMP409" /LENGTH=166 /DNA_ID=CAMNT_0043528335 /DNA_START=1 /DNA_END=499 /DNA_ORIENTATION=+
MPASLPGLDTPMEVIQGIFLRGKRLSAAPLPARVSSQQGLDSDLASRQAERKAERDAELAAALAAPRSPTALAELAGAAKGADSSLAELSGPPLKRPRASPAPGDTISTEDVDAEAAEELRQNVGGGQCWLEGRVTAWLARSATGWMHREACSSQADLWSWPTCCC